MTPAVQKLVYTIVAAALVVLAVAVPEVAEGRDFLMSLAGGLVGAGWVRRPGDLRVD